MQVLFDLRPRHLVQTQNQQVDPIRLFSVLFFIVFVAVSLYNILNTVMKLRDARAQLNSLSSDRMVTSDTATRLEVDIANMRVLKNKIKAYVEFTRLELPTVEFMAALEGAVPLRLKIVKLIITPGGASMTGAGVDDQDIIDFGAKLDSMKNIVTKVDAPVTTKSTMGNRMISNFIITCSMKSLSEIAESYTMPEAPPETGISSEDQIPGQETGE